MNTKALLLGAAASLAFAGSANAAHFKNWYVSIEGGANIISDSDVGNDTIDPSFGGGFAPTTSSFDTGWAGLGTFGFSWGDLRTELEIGYRANDLDKFTVGATAYNGGGNFDEFSMMGNLVYDWRLGDRWSLSLGAGLGADHISYQNHSGWHTIAIDDTQWAFAWQLIGGINYNLNERTELFVNYRYFNAQDPEFTEVDFFGDLHNDTYDNVTKHTVTIGLRFDLYPDETLAPPQEAGPPPPPPPPPSHFVVYFGGGKCNISPEADAVLSEAAAAAKSSGAATVTIVGHTDTVGSKGANQKLSECRADAAKSNLVGKGVAAGAITASGKGETELTVQTGDETREPQNNNATIDLH